MSLSNATGAIDSTGADDAGSLSEDTSNATNSAPNAISAVAEMCFGAKVTALCSEPPSSWNINDIVASALEGIRSGPIFSYAERLQHQAKLESLKRQGYHYPPCGNRAYGKIPTWSAVRINNQPHEAVEDSDEEILVDSDGEMEAIPNSPNSPVEEGLMETMQNPVEESVVETVEDRPPRHQSRPTTRPHTPPPSEVHHFHHISDTPNTRRAVSILGETGTLLETAHPTIPTTLPASQPTNHVQPPLPPPVEKILTTKHWGWDIQNLNKFMEEGWTVVQLGLDVPPANTWRDTETEFYSKHVDANLKKEFGFRLKVYKHMKNSFAGDANTLIEAVGGRSYKAFQKYFQNLGDK